MIRNPYTGEPASDADACRRSAQIDREEADTLRRDDPRRAALAMSASAWETQANIAEMITPAALERLRQADRDLEHRALHG